MRDASPAPVNGAAADHSARGAPRVTAKKIAEFYNVSEWTVMRCARAGLIPHEVIGRAIRFDFDRVATWVASGNAARCVPWSAPTSPKRRGRRTVAA